MATCRGHKGTKILNLPDITEKVEVMEMIRRALEEDIGVGDITTQALVPESATAKGTILSHGNYAISGIDVARTVFTEVDPKLKCDTELQDGQCVKPNQVVMTVVGPARGILTGERTALNFLQKMSGIATLTNQFVEKVKKYGVSILDTRKTTPGLRVLEKYAVLCGGGKNHRMGLYDRVLIKDNHIRMRNAECGMRNEKRNQKIPRLDEAVRKIRKKHPDILIEIEVENEAELESALKDGPDCVLLDNMPPEQLERCVKICAGRAKLEASGGITMKNVEDIAKTGVDAISLGCLTHSALAANFSLVIERSCI